MGKYHKPIAPHLSIYKPQITSIMSITHRVTGAILYFGLVALVWMVFIYAAVPDSAGHFFAYLHQTVLFKLGLLVFFYSLFHHTFSGLRYFIWGQRRGFSPKFVDYSALVVVVAAIIVALAFWGVAFG